MCPDLWTIFDFVGWLRTNEQSVAIWLEGVALVAIFVLELAEYKRQGRDKKEQHVEWVQQMAIMQSQADAAKAAAEAAKANAEAAKLGAQAVLNSERAWVEIILGPPEKDPSEEGEDTGLFECSIQIENKGKTIAHIESVTVGADCTTGTIPPEPLNFHTKSFRSLLGSGQKQTIRSFEADTAFSEGQAIVDGTRIGVLRIIVKYRDIVDSSILHETSAVYLFKKSLENDPERISTLSDYK